MVAAFLALALIINLTVHGWLGAILEVAALFLTLAIAVNLAVYGWLGAMGMKADHVRWVPSNGAAPAMQDLAAGGLDFTTCSVPEARAMLDAGRCRYAATGLAWGT